MIHFKNKKVLIMGLGLNGGGIGAAKFFYKQKAIVTVTDLKTKDQLKDSINKLKGLKIKYVLGGHNEEDFKNADLIIKNPDVPDSSPYLEIAKKNNVPVETDLSLFFKYSGTFIVGVTGTKGKSTTASLIFHILKQTRKNVFLAGNIGISPLEILSKAKKDAIVVLELSSFGLDDLSQSPNIAVITNIMQDHLNRYGTMQDYVESKKRIFKFQNQNDILVLNQDDPVLSGFAKEALAKIYYFSGKYDKANIEAAVTVAKILKIDDKKIEKALKSFKGVPNRQQFVKEVKGVKYFNDTTATIPEAVVFALDSFSGKFPSANLFLICGGVYKGVDYTGLAEKIKEIKAHVILFPGDGSEKIKQKLSNYEKIKHVKSMQEAVEEASKTAVKGDVVVLSPGASSFNMFKNEFDRGEQFVKFVKKIKR